MDAGGLGALIGVSLMVCSILTMRFYDVCQRRRARRQTAKTPLLIVRRHSRMNMILPK